MEEGMLKLSKIDPKLIGETIKTKNGDGKVISVDVLNRKAKVLIGLASGKKLYDKRETIKQRDLKRMEK